MKNSFSIDPLFPDCPIRNVLARFNGKWPLTVIYTLSRSAEPMRFKDIAAANPDISEKMLAQTLRGLEADDIIVRHESRDPQLRVDYALSPRGESLKPILLSLVDWAYNNMSEILESREKYYR
ncbi:MAG: helix-turn-helix transcriptional regulator [Bacteroidales bacterium]|nr:helix-turn-helix transcriptional regulator [Bacteroidales bacterium]